MSGRSEGRATVAALGVLLVLIVTVAHVRVAHAADPEVAVMSGADHALAAKRLVGELGAMDLRAELVSEVGRPAEAVVRFLARDRVSVVCCGRFNGERAFEIIQDADPSLLALRTAERLRALGLGAPPPAETFYMTVKAVPPKPPPERWTTLRGGAGMIAPSPGFGAGVTFSLAGSVPVRERLALSALVHATVSSPEHRSDQFWVESSPMLFGLGATYARESGPFTLHASAIFTYLRSPFRYRVGSQAEKSWLRQRFGPGASLTGFAHMVGSLSSFLDITAVYTLKDPAIRHVTFPEGSAFAPLVVVTLGLSGRFSGVFGR